MKKIKNLITIVLAVVVFAGCFLTFFTSKVNAQTYTAPDGLKARSTTPYEFNASELLDIYTINSGNPEDYYYRANRMDVTGLNAIKIKGDYGDGFILETDASSILGIERGYNENDTKAQRDAAWDNKVSALIETLVENVDGLTADNIKLTVTVKTPKITINNLVIPADTYEINTDTKVTDQVVAKGKTAVAANRSVFTELNGHEYGTNQDETEVLYEQQLVSVSAVTTSGDKYDMVLANDDSFYFVKDQSFQTELTYKAEVEGVDVGYTMDKGTCVPKYDTNNVKKDADVTAIIKSKNNMEILTVDGKEVGADKAHANADGWYYTTTGNKKEIAKVYKFDDYNNLTDNGTVVYDKNDTENNHRGKVKVTLGSIEVNGEQLTSEENISIQWPFRVIEDVQDPKEITEDTEKVTRTITTNLPIDKESLPEGWKFTDTELGKSQHQVYKEYTRTNGNVSETPEFKENGRKETVKPEIKIDWGKEKTPAVIPQTGIFSAVIILAIVGITVFGITRYRKINQ